MSITRKTIEKGEIIYNENYIWLWLFPTNELTFSEPEYGSHSYETGTSGFYVFKNNKDKIEVINSLNNNIIPERIILDIWLTNFNQQYYISSNDIPLNIRPWDDLCYVAKCMESNILPFRIEYEDWFRCEDGSFCYLGEDLYDYFHLTLAEYKEFGNYEKRLQILKTQTNILNTYDKEILDELIPVFEMAIWKLDGKFAKIGR